MEASQNQTTKPCRICETFFGSEETDFMCSKCFCEEKKKLQESEAASNQIDRLVQGTAEAVQLPARFAAVAASPIPVPLEPAEEVKEEAIAPALTEEVSAAQQPPAEEKPVQTNLNKCWHCSKKVGLVKTPCKCTYVFCPRHRHAEAHNCTFDYFAENKARLEKANPQIVHHKMEKIF